MAQHHRNGSGRARTGEEDGRSDRRDLPDDRMSMAREAAGGQDVRIGGGPTLIREFLAARLIDHMHIAVVPILLGRGERLWDGLEGLEKDYEIEATSSPSGVTHVMFTRVAS